jgi:hypothetical protein
MAETTMTHTEIVRMLSRALPRETRIESYWVAFRRCGAVRISVAGREMSMDVDRLAYYGSPATEVRRLVWSAQAFCERALGAERGPYW